MSKSELGSRRFKGARRGRRALALSAVGAAVALVPTLGTAGSPAGAATAPPCSSASVAGDWTSYGHDLSNSRNQPAETTIGTTAAATLAPAWSATVIPNGSGLSALNGTPIVADGCVFVGGTDGRVTAVNADTGAPVWQSAVLGDTANAGGGGLIVGSVVVDRGRVIAMINETGGPYAVALDEHSGKLVWKSPPVDNYPGAWTNANPVVYNGMVFFGFSVPEGDPKGQGGFGLVDEGDGHIITVTDTVPPADQAQGYAGGGIWSTPAVDPSTGFAYVGAGNPFSKQLEDRNTNAILKIDLNKGPGLGRIVAAYKGNVDQYQAQQLTQAPTCAASENTPLDSFTLDDPACGQLDLDFGASPNLFTDGLGHLLVGDLQKSGYYHVAYADTMERAWATPIGAPCALCNADSAAATGGSVFAVGTPGGVMTSLAANFGTLQWASPVADGIHYGSVSTADGVVYTVGSDGSLDAFDSATGAPLLHRPMSADAAQPVAGLTSSGVAIARHTVYVEDGGVLIAYRPGALP
ncbi:MAG TPA: PQQ-binding-like beta-propeller repeat protein [Acidimicrobiales bacterium]|nr:PQQ-binding-like beta-propeller repeat protein [Acidimicrobiales bacterium]